MKTLGRPLFLAMAFLCISWGGAFGQSATPSPDLDGEFPYDVLTETPIRPDLKILYYRFVLREDYKPIVLGEIENTGTTAVIVPPVIFAIKDDAGNMYVYTYTSPLAQALLPGEKTVFSGYFDLELFGMLEGATKVEVLPCTDASGDADELANAKLKLAKAPSISPGGTRMDGAFQVTNEGTSSVDEAKVGLISRDSTGKVTWLDTFDMSGPILPGNFVREQNVLLIDSPASEYELVVVASSIYGASCPI